ncbi:hypothetical protein AXW83_03045 [Bosea sp. PAMC 26642]|nr:hypothetical protein AXW83_03045 [Bosea sp. PAMC 26642]
MDATVRQRAAGGDDPGVSSDQYRAVMRRVAGSVSVILSGAPHALVGMTVNSVVSVSLDPPLILFCARAQSASAASILEKGLFSVNLLSDEQQLVSRYFAGGQAEPPAFDLGSDGDHVWLERTVGSFLCSVDNVHRAGDHNIIVGKIHRIIDNTSRPLPLVYRDGQYHSLAR